MASVGGFTHMEHLNGGRPFKYQIRCQKTGMVTLRDDEPILCQTQTYEPTEDPKVFELRETKDVWVDTRYEARLRLWHYINFTRKGLPKPHNSPFEGTEIGKSIPILPF